MLKLGGALSLYLALPGVALGGADSADEEHRFLQARDKVPDPENVFFEVQYPGKAPLKLAGHVVPRWATVKTFIGDPAGTDRPFAEKTVAGEIARSWI